MFESFSFCSTICVIYTSRHDDRRQARTMLGTTPNRFTPAAATNSANGLSRGAPCTQKLWRPLLRAYDWSWAEIWENLIEFSIIYLVKQLKDAGHRNSPTSSGHYWVLLARLQEFFAGRER